MNALAQAQLGILEAIQIGLRLEAGRGESLQSRTVETGPMYLSLVEDTRTLLEKIDLESVSERSLLQITSSLLQMQDSVRDVNSVLRAMAESGRAETAGKATTVERPVEQTAKELDWLEDKSVALALALNKDFVAELNRRIDSAPAPAPGSANWKQELAALRD